MTRTRPVPAALALILGLSLGACAQPEVPITDSPPVIDPYITGVAEDQPEPTTGHMVTEPEERPRVEVAFVLDTTGSMGGLIATAKRKIWSIANEMVSAKPSPEIRIGLVGFRDRSDAYVTKITDLDTDLDKVYANLMEFQANGGGDTPESVNQALREAVDNLTWTEDDQVLKVVFLVGDAPPHMDYDNDERYPEICERAVRKGLVINTLRCGGMTDTEAIWTEIAKRSEGYYAAIPQHSDAVATPFDARIAELGRGMSDTYLAYGEARLRRAAKASVAGGDGLAMDAADAEAPEAVAADRAVLLAKTGRMGGRDLVAAYAEGKDILGELDDDELPDDLKNMTGEERKAELEERSAKRKEIQQELKSLEIKRNNYIKAERAKAGGKSAFDAKVGDMLKKQAEKKGFKFEK
ncbi:MAG: vWA domain-containing protein [Planctomycetota bacterium]|jgi:Mg-chelatase subunit ChlD